MSPSIKFTLSNILFFGVIGSLIGGLLPAIPLGWSSFDSGMEHTDKFFITYILFSIIVGFIPASITGYIYSRMYKKEFLKKGTVDFWKELKFGLIASFLVMVLICYLPIFSFMIFGYFVDNATSTQLWNILRDGSIVSLILIVCGLIAGTSCSNLIREWNQKLSISLINK